MRALGLAHGDIFMGEPLDVASALAIFVGNTGSVHFGGAFLQSRLARLATGFRHHGPAGFLGHHSGLGVVGLALVHITTRSDDPVVF
jgi:hypothetical protein